MGAHLKRDDLMPTNKPRVSICVEPETYEVLSALSDISKKTRPNLINELLTASTPNLKKLLALYKKYETADKEIKDKLVSQLEESHGILLGALEKANQSDWVN